MARVWLARAWDPEGGSRRVALKVIRAEHAADPAFEAMLLDDDPLDPDGDSAQQAARLRDMRVGATVLGGRVTHRW